jgi:hypothetical protein
VTGSAFDSVEKSVAFAFLIDLGFSLDARFNFVLLCHVISFTNEIVLTALAHECIRGARFVS